MTLLIREHTQSSYALDNSRIHDYAVELHRREIREQELLAAQWILQNPDKLIADYTFVFRRTYEDGVIEFSIEAKEKL